MKCHDCNHEIAPGQKFCKNCGRDLRPRAERASRPAEGFEAAEHPDFAPALQKIVTKRQRGKNFWLWVFVSAGIVAFLVLAALGAFAVGIPVFLFFWAFGAIATSGPARITDAEYRALPGTADSNGKHRCAYCGHKGIYRHTPYRTSTTLNDCSKCGKNLFVS